MRTAWCAREPRSRAVQGHLHRAPWIERAGAEGEMLAQRDGYGVMVRERNVSGTSFHPELTCDDRVHHYFLGMFGGA